MKYGLQSMHLEDIEKVICSHEGVEMDEVRSLVRFEETVNARKIIWYFLEKAGQSFEMIAQRYGVKHGAIRNGIKVIEKKCVNSKAWRENIKSIEAKL